MKVTELQTRDNVLQTSFIQFHKYQETIISYFNSMYTVYIKNITSAAVHRPEWRVACSGFTQLTILLFNG